MLFLVFCFLGTIPLCPHSLSTWPRAPSEPRLSVGDGFAVQLPVTRTAASQFLIHGRFMLEMALYILKLSYCEHTN
jgi:hypothetical protein